jgi:hypothetical protein
MINTMQACFVRIEFLTFGVEFPSMAQDILHTLRIGQTLSFDLSRPDDGA